MELVGAGPMGKRSSFLGSLSPIKPLHPSQEGSSECSEPGLYNLQGGVISPVELCFATLSCDLDNSTIIAVYCVPCPIPVVPLSSRQILVVPTGYMA